MESSFVIIDDADDETMAFANSGSRMLSTTTSGLVRRSITEVIESLERKTFALENTISELRALVIQQGKKLSGNNEKLLKFQLRYNHECGNVLNKSFKRMLARLDFPKSYQNFKAAFIKVASLWRRYQIRNRYLICRSNFVKINRIMRGFFARLRVFNMGKAVRTIQRANSKRRVRKTITSNIATICRLRQSVLKKCALKILRFLKRVLSSVVPSKLQSNLTWRNEAYATNLKNVKLRARIKQLEELYDGASHCKCPVTKEIPKDPVYCAADGHVYERAKLDELIQKGGNSLINGRPIDVDDMLTLDQHHAVLFARRTPLQALRANGFTSLECKLARITPEECKNGGYLTTELEAIYTFEEFQMAKFSKDKLMTAGYTLPNLKTAGFTLKNLMDAGYSASDFRAADYMSSDLKAMGFSTSDLKAAGFTASDLKASGCSASDLIDAGYTASELMEYTSLGLRVAWYTALDLKNVGCTALDLKKAHYSVLELKSAGYKAPDLRVAGYTASNLLVVGFDISTLKIAGYKVTDLLAAKCTVKELQFAAFTAIELKIAGCTLMDLKAGGFNLQNLKAAEYTTSDLKAAGYWAKDFKAAGFQASNLQAARYTATDLLAAGYTIKELQLACFTATELKVAGCKLLDLKAAGFTIRDLKTAAYTASDIKAAGYLASDVKVLYSVLELYQGLRS